jgi:hypothetical protein
MFPNPNSSDNSMREHRHEVGSISRSNQMDLETWRSGSRWNQGWIDRPSRIKFSCMGTSPGRSALPEGGHPLSARKRPHRADDPLADSIEQGYALQTEMRGGGCTKRSSLSSHGLRRSSPYTRLLTLNQPQAKSCPRVPGEHLAVCSIRHQLQISRAYGIVGFVQAWGCQLPVLVQ